MASKVPTPGEIRKRCIEVQRGWTEKVRLSRIADKRLHPEANDYVRINHLSMNKYYKNADSLTPEPENGM